MKSHVPFAFARRKQALALCACAITLSACGGGGASPQSVAIGPIPVASAGATTSPPNIIVPQAGSIYLGAYVNPANDGNAPVSDLQAFEAQIGRKMALTDHYYAFGDAFPGAAEAEDLAEGRVPIESWNCAYPDAAIAAGVADSAIKARALALRAFGKPVFVRYLWEMNLPISTSSRANCYDPATDEPNGMLSPSNFIAAWRHIHSIFETAGATNVIFLWNPAGSTDGTPYYPGSDVVDWVGLDRYDLTTATFAQTFAGPYRELAPLGKPILVAETAALPANAAAYLAEASTTLRTDFPNIRGLVYFDAIGTNYDYVLGAPALAAFAALAAQPYFSAMPAL